MNALPVIEEPAPYDPRKAGARCDLCPLKGNNIVPPKASYLPTRAVFVGEAPGRKEEIHGVPFIGQTGVFLKGLAREVDIDMREVHLTNAALCRSNIDKENDEAAVCCAPRLLRELAAFPPSIPIVTLGKTSTLSVLGTRSIMHARGFVWTAREIDDAHVAAAWREAKKARDRGAPKWRQMKLKAQIVAGRSKLAGRTILPTVHPAFVLRSDTWLPILKLDLERISRWIRGELDYSKLCDQGPYVVVTKTREIQREFKKFKPVISVDIETGPSTPGGKDGADPNRNRILCVGISDGEHTVVVWPWRQATHAKLLNRLFQRSTAIGMHNGYNFDQIALARGGVPFEPIDDKLEDTLIAHHTFASHLPQRLAHVASVFCDTGPWKITFKRGSGAQEKGLPPDKLSPEDLCKYNAADARIQALVWLGMQADLESERAVYEVDKDNGRLCRGMIIGGIGVDLVRRKILREAVAEKEDVLLAKMREILKRPGFHPMQLSEVRRALFTTLRAPLAAADPTDSGLPSTSQKTLEKLKMSPTRAGRFADLLLQWRGAVKIRGTYIDSQILDKASKKTPGVSRTHFNWRSYGAASGRYSCRIQSCPRVENLKKPELGGNVLLPDGTGAHVLDLKDGVLVRIEGTGVERLFQGDDAKKLKPVVLETRTRELYIARPGCSFIYFDLSQAELRFAAYLSGDKSFIAACESGDVHTATAKLLFPKEAELIGRDPKGAGKPFRDVEKNSIFGFCYYAEPATIFGFVRAKGLPVEMRDVLYMHGMVRENFADYFRYVERNKKWVDKHGYLRDALSGRISWLGWHAGFPDVANRPIQGGIASLMNVRLPKIVRALPAGGRGVAQIHDAAILEVPNRHVDRVKAIVKKTWDEPVVVPVDGYGTSLRLEDGARSFVMPIDLKVGQRWSDFG